VIAAAHQLALDLPYEEARSLGDFLPASSNRAAYEAVLVWPEWPTTVLLVVGPEGAGKTHLARIWARRAGAVWFAAGEMWEPAEPLRKLGPATAAVVEDIEGLADEAQLFHLYNALAERRGSLMLTAEQPLAIGHLQLPDLRSRIATAWLVRIDHPCDALLSALLVKQFADRQVRVEAGVIEYLVSRMERSFAAVRRLVHELDKASLRSRKPIRLPLARAVLQSLTAAETDTGADASDGWLVSPIASPIASKDMEPWISA
jgi:chromosomal replication initiation ATPase DnaA